MADRPQPGHTGATKLAQLLGETIIHHAPWSADISETAKWAHTNEWLEGLETHLAGLIGPLFRDVVEKTDPPPAIRTLLADVVKPQAQFSGIVETLFTWGVAQAIISALLTPFLQELVNKASAAAVSDNIARPTDPSTIATAAARGLTLGGKPTVNMPQWAYEQAAQNGVSKEDIDLLASIVGLPPALQELFELYRRKVIPLKSDDPDALSVEKGLMEGDFRDDWVSTVTALAHAWLTPTDFVRAAVQKQMPYADARQWAESTGLDVETALPVEKADPDVTSDMFGLAYSIYGRPPGPVELGNMALRGIIPWTGEGAAETTFEQGIAESNVKTKWTPALRQLMQYVPAPGTIGTLLERGAITETQAEELWKQRGVPEVLAKGYAYMATQQHVGQDKLLAKSDITTGLYDGIISQDDAVEMLGLLGYSGTVAKDIIAITEFRREIRNIDRIVSHVGTLYEHFKLTATDALNALTTVGVSADQAHDLLQIWETMRIAPVRIPSAREIGRAVHYGTLTVDQAMAEMERLGYQKRDAAIVVSSYAEAAIPLPDSPLSGASVTAAGGVGLPGVPGNLPSAPGAREAES